MNAKGEPVFLRQVWPTRNDIHAVESKHVIPAMFKEVYSRVTLGSQAWQDLKAPEGKLYPWDTDSTYIKRPPFFEGMTRVSFKIAFFLSFFLIIYFHYKSRAVEQNKNNLMKSCIISFLIQDFTCEYMHYLLRICRPKNHWWMQGVY